MKTATIILSLPPCPQYPAIYRAHNRALRRKMTATFDLGRADRLRGLPCRSANGQYLDGWYSVPNPVYR